MTRVVVVGGGLGGLCLAQGLRRNGIEVSVHERDPALGSRAQGYRLHLDERGASGLRECLPPALYDLVVATASRPSRRMTVLDSKLKPLRVFDFPQRDPSAVNTSVDRQTLREILLTDLDYDVRLNAVAKSFERLATGQTEVRFADGSSDTGDVLVGADGVHSAIRAQYLPHARTADTGDRCIYGRTPLDSVRETLPEPLWDGFCAVTDRRKLGLALGVVEFTERPSAAAARLAPQARLTADESYVMWSLAARRGVLGADEELFARSPAALHELAVAKTASWHPQLRTLIEHSSPARTFALRIRSALPVSPWPPTAVTLLGDAIHAMTPARGSGANLALRDAGDLCRALTSGRPLTEAIGAYEATMLPRGFAAVRASALTPGPLATLRRLLRTRA